MRLIRQIRLTKKGFLRLTKKALVSYLISSIIILSSGLIYLFNPFTTKKAEASWFNDDWGFRKAITVTVTSNSSDITNLQTLLTVDTTGITTKLQSSCQDLRFTNVSGKILPYYIDSCNNNSATNKIWVLADLVPKNTTTYTMYMYYGNPSVGAGSSSAQFDNVVGLVGYWTLNDGGSSATATDSSVVGNNGSLSIGASGTQTTATQAWTNGGTHASYGNAINFDGTDDFVDTANITQINSITKMTVSAWIKQSALGTQQAIVAKWDYQTQGAWIIQTHATTNTELSVFIADSLTDAGGNVANTTNANLTINTWNQVAFVYDGTQADNAGRLKVYVNGALTSVTYSGTIPASLTSASSTVKIGKFGGTVTRYFNGIIDDVHIYNTARTATQVSNDYNNAYTIANTAVGTITPSTSFATEEKAPQPVAWWKFDDGTGTNAQDATTNNKDGTLSGTTKPAWQTEDLCVSGKCLYFDGSTSYVSLGNNALGSMSGAFSIEGWIRTASDATIISEYESGVCGDAVFGISSGVVQFHDGSVSNNNGNVTVTDNKWHHVVYVYNGSTGMTYVDGVAGADTTGTTWRNTCANTDVRIGSRVGSNFFKGFIDDLKVYNYARSAVQVKADFNARQNPHGAAEVISQGPNNQPGALSNGLVGYWKTDETSGNLTDSSGNGLTGTATGTTVVAGKFGNARSFNGTTDVITVSDNSVIKPTSEMTVGMWCNVITLSQINCAATKHSTTTNNGYAMFLNSDNKFYFQLGDGTTWAVYQAVSAAISATGWYHVVGTHNANSTNIYVNGAASGTTGTGGTISQNTNNLLFGKNVVSSAFYIGTMDEIRIYNRALSPAEVTQLYNFAPGPVGYWKFDENSGSTANDSSGNANSGTATGSPSWVAGKYGSALKYNGSSQYTSITAGSALQITNGLTAEAWINPVAASNFVLFKETTGGNGDWWINFSSGNWQCATAGGTGTVATGVSAALNQWTHITLAYTASSLKCYVNGVLSGTTDTTPGTLTGNTNAVMVAGYPTTPTTYFNGSVDDVRIYNYERTPDQIVSDMNAGHPPPAGGLGSPVGSALGYWKFDEGYGTTAHNSGNQSTSVTPLNGTITNAVFTNSGKFGKALTFDGSGDYVTVTDQNSLDVTNLTLSVWIRVANLSPAANKIIIWKGDATGTTISSPYALEFTTANQIYFQTANNVTTSNITSNSTLLANTWYHIVVTADGTTLRIYINGIEDKNGAQSITPFNSSTDLTIGGLTGSAVNSFDGQIDEVKIYNYGLTAAQVKLDMNRQSAQVLGALSDNTSAGSVQASSQEYCVPGDSTSCAAPVGEWKFEEGSGNVNDSSGNGYTGTATGTTVVPGKFGKARSFNGTSDLISLGTTSPFRQSSAITYSFWVNIPSGGGGQAMGVADVSGSGSGGMAVTTTNIVFYWTPTTPQSDRTYTATTTVSTNTWHHIAAAISFSGAGSGQIYLDGIPQTTTLSGAVTTATPATSYDTANGDDIGGRYVNSQNYFNGKIDNVRIYNYVRSGAQVAWDYNRGGPVGWWKMDECQGTVAHDSSGNGNTGTITVGATGTYTSVGTCASNSASSMWYNGATGKINYSLAFDGTDDYVDTGTGSSLNTITQVSGFQWIKPSTSGSQYIILSKYDTNNDTYELFEDSNSKVRLITKTSCNGANAVDISSTTVLSVSTWYNVGFTYDGTTTKLYINGVQENSSTGASGNLCNGTAHVLIGARTVSGSQLYFPGQIDDVRVYNYALTATQVKGLYNNGAATYAPSTGAP